MFKSHELYTLTEKTVWCVNENVWETAIYPLLIAKFKWWTNPKCGWKHGTKEHSHCCRNVKPCGHLVWVINHKKWKHSKAQTQISITTSFIVTKNGKLFRFLPLANTLWYVNAIDTTWLNNEGNYCCIRHGEVSKISHWLKEAKPYMLEESICPKSYSRETDFWLQNPEQRLLQGGGWGEGSCCKGAGGTLKGCKPPRFWVWWSWRNTLICKLKWVHFETVSHCTPGCLEVVI